MKTDQADRLAIEIHANRQAMGQAAATAAAMHLRDALARQGEARIIVASAPSQNELLAGLAAAPDIDWGRVTIFHMDEYLGLPDSHPASFRSYQQQNLLAHIQPAAFHGIRGETSDAEAECARYTALLKEGPIDLLCMGIGENGHIAFNDPPVADFNDTETIKVVELDRACREQQVHDGCFPSFDDVPTQAFTLTCPTLMAAERAICVVPGKLKAQAVASAVQGPVSESCPASALRRHPAATLYLDEDAAAQLP